MQARLLFQGPPTLQYLNLNHNNMGAVVEELAALTGLKGVNLQSNSLTSISGSAFCNSQLEELWLRYNELASIPDLQCVSDTLQKLDLRNNVLTSIAADDVGYLRSLQTLRLERNDIASIESTAFCGTSLRGLYLSFNELTVLPNLTCVQDTLRDLGTDGNQGIDDHSLAGDIGEMNWVNLELTTPPGDDVLRLLRTTYIHLRCHTSSDFIFDNFNFLPDVMRVRSFNIRDCQVPIAPDYSIFPPGNNVVQVVLENCGLHTIHPHTFRTLTNLHTVSLAGNSIVSLDSRIFATQMNIMQKIYIHSNPDFNIPDKQHIFAKLTRLRYVHLSLTALSVFPDLSASCSTIEEVYLYSTHITEFDYSQTFENCSQLELVHLRSSLTEGQTVPDYSAVMARGVARVSLQHGQLWCGCENAWIARVGRGDLGADAQENLLYSSSITCYGPSHLEGRLLVELADEDFVCPGVYR